MECLFCKIINREIPADIVYEDEHVLAFNDISPMAPTHQLIIPKKHIATLNDIEEDDLGLVGRLQVHCCQACQAAGLCRRRLSCCDELQRKGRSDGVPHAHAFIRWSSVYVACGLTLRPSSCL